MNSGFCDDAYDNSILLSQYALNSTNSLAMSHLQGPLKMGPIGCPKMSERYYHYSLHNNPEQCSYLT